MSASGNWEDSNEFEHLSNAFDQGAETDSPNRAEQERAIMSYMYALQATNNMEAQQSPQMDLNEDRSISVTGGKLLEDTYDIFGDEEIFPEDQDVFEAELSILAGELANADMLEQQNPDEELNYTLMGPGETYRNDGQFDFEELEDVARTEYVDEAKDLIYPK